MNMFSILPFIADNSSAYLGVLIKERNDESPLLVYLAAEPFCPFFAVAPCLFDIYIAGILMLNASKIIGCAEMRGLILPSAGPSDSVATE